MLVAILSAVCIILVILLYENKNEINYLNYQITKMYDKDDTVYGKDFKDTAELIKALKILGYIQDNKYIVLDDKDVALLRGHSYMMHTEDSTYHIESKSDNLLRRVRELEKCDSNSRRKK